MEPVKQDGQLLTGKKFVFFANYLDALFNAFCALLVILSFVYSVSKSEFPPEFNPMRLSAFWVAELYVSMAIANRGRLIASMFAVPLKAVFSAVSIFALACLSQAIFRGEDPISARISKGAISGLVLWFCSKLINPNKPKIR